MQTYSKQEAADLGLKTFLPNFACVRGHTSERLVVGGCLACRTYRGQLRHYTPEQRERKLQMQREYQVKNRERISKRAAAYRARWVADGRCKSCGKRDCILTFSRCENCQIRSRETSLERRDRLHKQMLCGWCGMNPHLEAMGMAYDRICQDCYFKKTSHRHFKSFKHWKDLRAKFIAQDGRCAYTGIPLTLAINDSLDHIKSQYSSPELARDINNVEWVTRDVNLIKGKLCKDEFLALCKLIVKRNC